MPQSFQRSRVFLFVTCCHFVSAALFVRSRVDSALRQNGDGSHRNLALHFARNVGRNVGFIEAVFGGVVIDVDLRLFTRLRLPGICELRVIPGELAVIEFRSQVNRPLRVFRNVQKIVDRVGRAGLNGVHIKHAARLPGIALVDLIAVGVELIRLIKMRPRLDRALAAIFHLAAPEDHLAGRIRGLKFQPDIEGIERAAGEEVSDLARSDHHVDASRRAGAELRLRLIEGAATCADFADESVALLLGFFSHGRTRAQLRAGGRAPDHGCLFAACSTGEAAKISTEMKPEVRNFCSMASCSASRSRWRAPCSPPGNGVSESGRRDCPLPSKARAACGNPNRSGLWADSRTSARLRQIPKPASCRNR
jgi:hypothetical protein